MHLTKRSSRNPLRESLGQIHNSVWPFSHFICARYRGVRHTQMKFFNTALFLFLFSFDALTCMLPNQGKEFDSLIEITKLDEKDEYLVSLPRTLGSSSKFPTITLVYQSIELEDDCVESILADGTRTICLPKDQSRQEIQLQNIFKDLIDVITNEEFYSGKITIEPKKGYLVFVSVMWETEVCPTFGEKEVIFSNMSNKPFNTLARWDNYSHAAPRFSHCAFAP